MSHHPIQVALILLALAGCGEDQPRVTNSPPVAPSSPDLDSAEQAPAAIEPDVSGSKTALPPGAVIGESSGEVRQFILNGSQGTQVTIINYGAIVQSIRIPDRDGTFANVTLGFKTLEAYQQPGPYFGAICGRYANRIALGKFHIGEHEYTLATNNESNHLHGGLKGFDKRLWNTEWVSNERAIGLRLHYDSPDGEEGYPGQLSIEVTYWLPRDGNELRIEYTATTDKPTVLNLTNHCYWNLAGSGDILDHRLTLHADRYLPVDKTLIPIGKLAPVDGTPMDFRKPHSIGERIDQVPGGYDHCYVVNPADQQLRPVGEVYDPKSGRMMQILSTEPGVQLYSGNFLDGSPASGGHKQHQGFCLESQHFPDSPNQPDFPTTLLKPGETYRQTTVYRFSVR